MFLEIHFSVPSLEISMGIKDTDTWKFSGALKISRAWKNPGPLEISRTPGNFQASWKFRGGCLISHWTSSGEIMDLVICTLRCSCLPTPQAPPPIQPLSVRENSEFLDRILKCNARSMSPQPGLLSPRPPTDPALLVLQPSPMCATPSP